MKTAKEMLAELNAPLPWRSDDEGLVYDANGEELGYFVAIPDTATARVLAKIAARIVSAHAGSWVFPTEIPREGDLVRLARPPAPIDGQAGAGPATGHDDAAREGSAGGGPQDVARHPYARPLPPRPISLAEALALLHYAKGLGYPSQPQQQATDCALRVVAMAAERIMRAAAHGPVIPALEVTGP